MQLESFTYKSKEDGIFQDIRTIKIDGDIWFCASDVSKVLGYSKNNKNLSNTITRHCKSNGIMKHKTLTSSGFQLMTYINESNVYRLITRSKLPSAEKFQEWIFDKVIPQIRKKGYYGNIERSILPKFYLRYKDNFQRVDRGYFSIISELFITLYSEFEKVGYIIPDKGIDGKQLYPDISVGQTFPNYLEKIKSPLKDSAKRYSHTFGDGREDVEAKMYPLELLAVFRRFIYDVWMVKYALPYFKKKDPVALDYLPKLLSA